LRKGGNKTFRLQEQHLSTFNINPGAEEMGGGGTFKLNFELHNSK